MSDTISPLAAVGPLLALFTVGCERSPDLGESSVPLVVSQSCEVQTGCTASAGDMSVQFTLGPDLRALSPFPVRVVVPAGRSVDSVTASFAMQGMDMGPNRYRLISDGAESWIGNVTLPVCASGRRDWTLHLDIASEGDRFVAEAPFSLTR
jgi:hypothetical protein